MHIYTYLSLGRRTGKLHCWYLHTSSWLEAKCSYARRMWGSLILPEFSLARSSIEVMGASSFLGYIYTDVGERGRSWRVERKSWGKSPGEDLRLQLLKKRSVKCQKPWAKIEFYRILTCLNHFSILTHDTTHRLIIILYLKQWANLPGRLNRSQLYKL